MEQFPPFVWHLLAFFISFFVFMIMRKFLKQKNHPLIIMLTILLFRLSAGMIIYIGDPTNVLGTMPFFFLGVVCFFEGRLVNKLSIAMIIFSLMMAISTIFDTYLKNLEFSLLLKVCFWFLVWLVVRSIEFDKSIQLSTRLWRLINILTLMPLVSMLSIVILTEESLIYTYLPNYAVLIFAVLSSLALLFVVSVLSKQQQLEEEATIWELQNQYYKALEESQLQIRQLRHDIANHFSVMSGLEENDLKSYLAQLSDTPAMDNGHFYCENNIVNAVITSKIRAIADSEIKYNIRVNLPKHLFVYDIDLCSFFANALDNAIESCKKVEEGKRFLTLNSNFSKGLFVMELENAMFGQLTIKNNQIVTSKTDKSLHGFGLSSIRKLVDKYDGSISIASKDDVFSLLISIPTR